MDTQNQNYGDAYNNDHKDPKENFWAFHWSEFEDRKYASHHIDESKHLHVFRPIKTPLDSIVDASAIKELKNQFNILAEKWEDDTGLYATITPKVVNGFFYDLLLLGRNKHIITLILERLEKGAPSQWHIVLKAITKANPVPKEDITRSQKIKEAWISWGKDHNYIK